MRVLLVGNHWTEGPGGAETMLVLTADLLRAAGHEVVPFAVAEERTLPTPVRASLPVAAGTGARTRFGEAWAGVWSPSAYRALARVVDAVRPDVAHVHHVFERLTVSVLDALRRRGPARAPGSVRPGRGCGRRRRTARWRGWSTRCGRTSRTCTTCSSG